MEILHCLREDVSSTEKGVEPGSCGKANVQFFSLQMICIVFIVDLLNLLLQCGGFQKFCKQTVNEA